MTQLKRLEDLRSRLKTQNSFDWRSIAFDKQRTFIEDPSRLKAAFTTRRGAKSYADGIHLLKDAYETPKCNCLFLGLTRLSAKGIIWKDVLKDINDKQNLNIKFHESELTATTNNGSVIYVSGVDVDENERKKLFGRKYKLIVIDEAALFGIDMYDLVYVVLKPTTVDLRGTIVMSGMASNITQGLFYDITTRKEKGWSLHEWSAHDNPHVKVQWQEELDEIERERPEFMKTARFKQAYLNQWVVDQDALVYKYNEHVNRADSLPLLAESYRYVLAVDLGHSPDPSAFVVAAYHESARKLYFVHAEKKLEMDITDVANKIKELERTFTFDVKVVDNANKQAVEELNNRHGSNLIPADKTGKSDFINLMNDEMIQGNILCLPGASEMANEWKALIWATEQGKIKIPRKEHEGLANHLADAGLYGWRHCYQYLFKEPVKPPNPREQSVWERAHIEKLQEQIRREQNPNHYDAMFQPDEDLFDMDRDELI